MTAGSWALVILTGVLLPMVGFFAGALVSKHHWKTVLRDRWHRGFTTGRQSAYEDVERYTWKQVRGIRALYKDHVTTYQAGFLNGWESAAAYVTDLVERLADDDDGAL